jgi:hypothetical protein
MLLLDVPSANCQSLTTNQPTNKAPRGRGALSSIDRLQQHCIVVPPLTLTHSHARTAIAYPYQLKAGSRGWWREVKGEEGRG